MAACHVVMMFRRAFPVVRRIARRRIVVMGLRFPGAVRYPGHFAWIFANNPGVESGEDSNQQNPWQQFTHDRVHLAE